MGQLMWGLCNTMKRQSLGGSRARIFSLATVLVAAIAVTGCSGGGNGPASAWNDGTDKGYVSGDGSTTSIPPSERTEPVVYSGTTEQGDTYGSNDTLGSVTVINFWYAGCAPCRAEAPEIVEVYDEFGAGASGPDSVKFVGVNTRDQVAQAAQFSKEFGIEYPSIMDNAGDRDVQRAFAGQVPLNAVPTTLVLDAEGRVAHRIIGQLAAASQLRQLVNETLAEG